MHLQNMETAKIKPVANVTGVSLEDVAVMLKLPFAEAVSLCEQLNLQPRTSKRSAHSFLDEVQMRQLMLARRHRYPEKAQRISLMMCKGGVGKTTVSFYLAQRLAQYGARVLVIDTDPQGNLTAALCRSFGATAITESTPVIMDVLSKQCSIHQAIKNLSPFLHMIPSTALNSLLDKKLSETSVIPVFELHRQLSLINQQYDYIVIDSAPALNLINASIMYASDRILLPLFMYEFSLMGLEQTLNEISDLQQTFKFTVDVNVLVNKFNHRERLSFGYLGQLAKEHRHLVLNSVIRASSHLQYSIATGKSLFGPRKSSGKDDFDSLAREIMDL